MERDDRDIDDRADEAFDASVVEFLDDWSEAVDEDRQRTEAKRGASGMSPELLNLRRVA